MSTMKRRIVLIVWAVCLAGLTAAAGCKGKQNDVQEPAEETSEAGSSVDEAAADKEAPADNPRVIIETSMGSITLELFSGKAPVTVKSFLSYVDKEYYDGTIFHRIMSGFMIQGGGFEPGMKKKQTDPPIKNEAGNGLSNERGTVAMARTDIVDSATSQFFINHADNSKLDHKDETVTGFGYCVFGKVVEGMDIVDKIADVPTKTTGSFKNVPVDDVVIKSVKRVTP